MNESVEESSAVGEPFGGCWRDHEVRLHRRGVKGCEHPAARRLSLPFEPPALPGRPDLMLSVTAEPVSESARRVRLLSDGDDAHPTLAVPTAVS
ncbi:hypothetical protein ABT381_00625 [Streptomyces sp. NPDC000151]|uniref:MmyB family transcriptional regulator n=1 Tax=Streptomyces sp. NPDC000151 TaxID=3154244 RepID=UPI0033250845